MHSNTLELTRPADNLLAQCHTVYINNPAFRMWQMKRFCLEQALSLIWSELVEANDVSDLFDEAAAFYFADAADATMFALKFK